MTRVSTAEIKRVSNMTHILDQSTLMSQDTVPLQGGN